MRTFFQVLNILLCTACLAMNFKPPTPEETLEATGNTEGVPLPLRKALEPGDDFAPLAPPNPGDWLAEHFEAGQTFEDFVGSKFCQPDRSQDTVYLQPLGEFSGTQRPPLEVLKDYASGYFMMPVKILAPIAIGKAKLTQRVNPYTRKRQLLTRDILILLQRNFPADAFCLMAITMEDLYPDPAWNFVFGQAAVSQRVAVFSFARYNPSFYGQAEGKDDDHLLLHRSCKVLVHEMAHMFSLGHCIYFKCVMNGSNHLQESDARPLHLCPVCLRKLQFSTEFDVVDRYHKLLKFYRSAGFTKEVRWVSSRLKKIRSNR